MTTTDARLAKSLSIALLAVAAFSWSAACSSGPTYVEAPLLGASDARELADAGHTSDTRLGALTISEHKEERPPPFHVGESWTGTMLCARGMTMLTIRIVAVEGDDVRGIVDYAHPPSGVWGRYSVAGRYDGTMRKMKLEGDDWITQPPGETMFEFEGVLEGTGRNYMGRVVGHGCTSFHVQR